MAKRPKRKSPTLTSRPLGELISANHRVLEVLDRHGISFCAGCFLTLTSPLEKVAAYHAVPDLKGFLSDLKRALKG